MAPLLVRTIGAAEHLRFLRDQPNASFLQTPAWGKVKSEWGAESIGWFLGEQMIGAGLILYRSLPLVKRFLAYLPEGPVLNWQDTDVPAALHALRLHAEARNVFAVRLGPPVVTRRWSAQTVKAAIADERQSRLGDIPADVTSELGMKLESRLRELGWRPLPREGFSEGQPRYVFQLRLAGRSEEQLLAGMNQQWRRNIKKALQAGVVVTRGNSNDLPAFHSLYAQTADRDGFIPRPLEYFQRMFAALRAEDPDRIRLYLAHYCGELVAAATWVRLGGHVWYSYGASSTANREARGSNAVQWRMIADARNSGADTYDLRGITDTLVGTDPHIGLIQFKVGTGGEAVENLGEWDLPVNRPLYRAFDVYLRRRR